MNMKILAEKIVKKALKLGADESEVYLENNREFELSIRNGDIENIKQANSKGMGLTVFKEKRLGFSYTSDFSEKSIEEFTEKAVQLCVVADPKPWNGLPDFEPGKGKDLDLYDPSISGIPNEKKIKIAKEVEKIALNSDKRITKTEGGYFGDYNTEITIVNSKGVSLNSKRTGINFFVGMVAGEGDDMHAGYWGSTKRHFKDLDKTESVARIAVERAVSQLGAKPVETQKVPVVFDRYAARLFWYGVIRAMYGDSVYKKTTFLTDYLNKTVASKLITVIDNPTISRHVASIPFDGEGKITGKNILIDKGVLKMFIYDTITARKAGVKVNTLTRRSGYRSPPYASFLNLIVKNGNVSKEKIISGIKNGFYVTSLRGIGTDVPTGTYSAGASGFWVKDGEIAFPVDGVTLGGNAIDMLKNIEMVANDIDIRGRLNSPSFKISEVSVGGKKKRRSRM